MFCSNCFFCMFLHLLPPQTLKFWKDSNLRSCASLWTPHGTSLIHPKGPQLPYNQRRNPPLQLSLWWSTFHPSQLSSRKPSSAAWQQTPAGFCILICLTDSNELFLVVILVLSYLLVSLNFSLKLFICKSCSLLIHEALNLFIWRCATEHSSSCL
jgi:hypothetical protein